MEAKKIKEIRNIYSCRVYQKGMFSRTNKTFRGTTFHFPRSSASCLPSAARLDIADDQGKGKVGPRKVLFVQENSFLSQYTLAGYIFLFCRGLSTTCPEIGKQVNLQDPFRMSPVSKNSTENRRPQDFYFQKPKLWMSPVSRSSPENCRPQACNFPITRIIDAPSFQEFS